VEKAVATYTVTIPSLKKTIRGQELSKALQTLQRYERLLARLARKGYTETLLLHLFGAGLCRETFLGVDKVEELKLSIEKTGFECSELHFDEEHSLYEFTAKNDVNPHPAVISHSLHHAPEFLTAQALHEKLKDLDRPPFLVENGESAAKAEDRRALLTLLLDSVKAKYHIQRYKGLGEMNPEQLWETTMDPAKRRLLQVRVDDPVEAGSLFSVLMGDAVEPRRKFIEENALNVTNLDI